jgi:CheY-like chemotaxis protein
MPADPDLPPLAILAADDVPQNLELLQLALQRYGHQVTAVQDGQAAEAFGTQRFDVILMDVDVRHRRADRHAQDPRHRSATGQHADADHRADRQRDGGRPPRGAQCRHGRLCLQAAGNRQAAGRNGGLARLRRQPAPALGTDNLASSWRDIDFEHGTLLWGTVRSMPMPCTAICPRRKPRPAGWPTRSATAI